MPNIRRYDPAPTMDIDPRVSTLIVQNRLRSLRVDISPPAESLWGGEKSSSVPLGIANPKFSLAPNGPVMSANALPDIFSVNSFSGYRREGTCLLWNI